MHDSALTKANLLKPALARGELQCIGATTLDEYRKYIEKDRTKKKSEIMGTSVEKPRKIDDFHDFHGVFYVSMVHGIKFLTVWQKTAFGAGAKAPGRTSEIGFLWLNVAQTQGASLSYLNIDDIDQ